MNQLLILAPFCSEHLVKLQTAVGTDWELVTLPADAPEDDLRYVLSTAQVVIGEPAPGLLRESKTVKWVQMTWAGTDLYTRGTIPFPKEMRLTNVSGAFGPIMSQYAVGQVLSLMQNFPAYLRQQEKERWRDLGPVGTLEKATVLIFGAGDIGTWTAKRLSGFDTYHVGVCRNTAKERPGFHTLCTLEEAERWLPQADVVICCIPNKAETCHYLNRRRLEMMKTGAVLVNIGRGNFVDCDALADVLTRGTLRGAALDVTDPEPLPVGHPLWKLPNCIITPHVSGGSFGRLKGTEDRICDICCENLRRWVAGKPLNNVID